MSDESTVKIRRYPNRRLYDRSQRQYVTLQDVESYVLAGRTVQVLDSKSDEDLTRQILTQILAERHPHKMEMFPVAMLHNILRANDIALEVWRGYLRQSLAAIETWQKATIPFALPLDWMSSFVPALAPIAPGPDAANRRIEELSDRVGRLEAGAGQPSLRPPTNHPLDVLEERLDRLEDRDKNGKPRRAPRNRRS
ncbi:MAG: polyhydroxyalkanoate synthesis regulator DNA-binding domain-containing protein [Isosphaerales bacterium]